MQGRQTTAVTNFNYLPLAQFDRLKTLGFGHWIYSAIPDYHNSSDVQVNRISSYPSGFIDSYNQLGFAAVDPFTPYWFKHNNPASFRKVRRSAVLTPRQKELMSLNADFVVNKGIVFPLNNVIGFKAVLALSFDGSLAELNTYIGAVEKELYQISRSCNEQLLRHHRSLFLGNCPAKLTSRQQQVLSLLARGRLTKQIADQLAISLNAVDRHVANIKMALSAKTTAEAVARALQWHLI